MKLKSLFQVLGIIAVIFTLFPFVALDYWWIRMFDFPHTQLTIFTFFTLLLYFIRFDIRSWRDYTFIVVLMGCFLFQLLKIYPYTPFSAYEVGNSEEANFDNTLSLLVANVLQKNTRSDLLLDEIIRHKPNVIVLTEANERWRQEIWLAIKEKYPYKAEIPLENTYGMLMYSNYQLENPEIRFLVDDSIPSIHTVLLLPSGEKIQVHSIHPTPPMPQHNPSSTDRDSEMMQIAKMVKDAQIPVLVTGDFNDVAWSQTTTLFQNRSKLLDPRVGRGFYNTYDATSEIMRWPLDHLFVSEEFRVLELIKGNDIKSDHFPLYAQLSLEPERAKSQEADEPTKGQIERADKEIQKEKEEKEENGKD